jgi:hypothetical protein
MSEGIKNSKTPLEGFLKSRYDFRMNEVSGNVEFKKKGGKVSFKLMGDYAFNSILRNCRADKIFVSADTLRRTLASDFIILFNPLKGYLDNLPSWDGNDYIGELSDTVLTTDQEWWKICFKKWFVAFIGSLFNEKTINHTMVVLVGAQGKGKTSWLENLLPIELSKYRYTGSIVPGNKDSEIHLSECALINLDEFESLTRSKMGDLKSLITKSKSRIRRPYGTTSVDLIRRASFVGSTNKTTFLTDPSGNRRLLCFLVTKIVDYGQKSYIDLAFAQALHEFKDKFRFYFNAEETAQLEIKNKQFCVVSDEEVLISEHICLATDPSKTCWGTTTKLAAYFSEEASIPNGDSLRHRIGIAMRRMKFPRTKKDGRYGYEYQLINS